MTVFIEPSATSYNLFSSSYYKNSVTTSNLTTNNYFGIAAETKSNGQDVKVTRPGSLNKNQSGMSAGKDMYVTEAGTIVERTTTTSTTNNSPTVAFTTMDNSDTVSSDGEARMVYDSTSETFVAVYENAAGSDYPYAVAGTWSDGTITWGTPVVLESNSCNREVGIAVGNGKVWTAWARNSANIMITSLSISGTAITVATPTDTSITWSNELGMKLSYDISSNYLLLFDANQSTGSWLFKVKPYYTTSGGGLTAGATSTISTNGSLHHNEFDVVYDPDTSRTVVVYTDDSNSNYGTANVIQSSGTTGSPTVTIGSDVVFSGTDAVDGLTATYDTANDKVFVGYHNTTDGITKGIIGTVTGGGTNSISFAGEGTINDYTNNSSSYLDVVYDSDESKIIAVYRDDDHTSDGLTYRVITSGASSFSVSSAAVISTNDNQLQSGAAAFGAGKGTAVATRDADNSSKLSISTLYYATTSSTVVNGSQFVGTARSGTDLELSGPPSELVAMANGSITKGKPVILRTDGDFQQAGLVPTTIDYSAGTETAVSTEDNYFNGVSYNPDQNRYVAFYSESNFSYYGYAKSFTVTDKVISNTVSMGAFNTSSTGVVDCCYIGNSKHIVFFTDGNSYVNARVVQLASDGTATYGTKVTINSSSSESNGSCYYDSDKDVAVITMGMDTNTAKSIAVSVSGVTITAGSKVTVPSSDSNVYYTSSSYNTEEKIGLVVWDSGSTSKLNSATISLSGTGNRTITFNSVLEVYNGSNEIKKGSLTYDSLNKKHFLAYSDASNMKGVVLTVSGTSVTKGTSATIYTGGETNIATQGTNQGGISIYHRDASSPYYLKGVVATISGTDFTLSNEATLNATEIKNGRFGNAVYNPLDFTTTVIYVVTASFDLKATATIPNGSLSSTNLTSSNFIGFAENTVADNEDVKVKVISQSDENQTGLTTASQYYVQTDGTLSTTAGTPSVLGGTALSSTSLLIKS